jgi:D-alanyl-D-alanine carboxypeptidase (penicillin-binding protein 5/6)
VLRRAAATALLAFCVAAPPLTAHASPDRRSAVPHAVGGDALASPGLVVRRAAGVPFVPNVSAASFVVADLDSGDVLAAKGAHVQRLPASTLKTLTAVALLPKLPKSAGYRATFGDVNVEGSKVGVVTNHRYYTDDLFRAMLMVSGNDAANCLASAAGGKAGPARGVALMNETARKLQANDTHAVNANGLDAAGQLTSAYDLALIGRAGMRNARFAQYVRTLRARFPAPGTAGFEIYNHNKLLTRYAGALGIKGGYTVAARHTFVAAAQRGGHRIIVTLLKAESLYADLTALLDWGLAVDGRVPTVGELVEPLPPPGAKPAAGADADAPLAAAHAPTASGPVRGQAGISTAEVAAVAVPITGGGMLVVLAALRRRRRVVRVGEGLLRLP